MQMFDQPKPDACLNGEGVPEHIAAEDVLSAFCLGDVRLTFETVGGSIVRGRMFGLRTDECVGARGEAFIAPNWVISLLVEGGTPREIKLTELRRIHRSD